MARIWIRREVEIPNHMALARLEKCPELGPKLLFFSGGTALKKTSNRLINYTHNSIHLITPFDSGGSSAKLRDAFQMPAVGDIRNRLMALADQTLRGNPEIFELFAHRLPKGGDPYDRRLDLERMVKGKHPLVSRIPDPMRKIVRNHLHAFWDNMPEDFDLAGASIGNLVLTGGYFDNRRHLDPVIFIFSNLVQVRGTVRPVVNKHLHLAAEFDDGETIVGQHLLTGKEAKPLNRRISRLYLTEDRDSPRPIYPAAREKVCSLIRQAELICYPMGSFHSSLLASLLPRGVGASIGRATCPKVYVPSTGEDPECFGLSVADQVETLASHLMADEPGRATLSDVLQYVLVDSKHGRYPGGLDIQRIRRLGLEVIDCTLIGYGPSTEIDDRFLVPILLSLV
ncbi:MAG: GAK system CofD-like protein [Humidesulfovibrio sp.]